MTTIETWQKQRDAWADHDLELMTTEKGWDLAAEKQGINIWRRSFPDDPNDLFKWEIPALEASHTEVFDVFRNRFHDYHQYWTKEYTGGYDVEILDDRARVAYQQYNSGIPLISNRDWLVVQWDRELDASNLQISFRSVVHEKRPRVKGYERITWWGAHLFRANPDGTTSLAFLDRENQGGNFPPFLMNRMMPKYLIYQYRQIVEFFARGGIAAHAPMPPGQNSARVQGLCQ